MLSSFIDYRLRIVRFAFSFVETTSHFVLRARNIILVYNL